jgi:hypothetical protein
LAKVIGVFGSLDPQATGEGEMDSLLFNAVPGAGDVMRAEPLIAVFVVESVGGTEVVVNPAAGDVADVAAVEVVVLSEPADLVTSPDTKAPVTIAAATRTATARTVSMLRRRTDLGAVDGLGDSLPPGARCALS